MHDAWIGDVCCNYLILLFYSQLNLKRINPLTKTTDYKGLG